MTAASKPGAANHRVKRAASAKWAIWLFLVLIAGFCGWLLHRAALWLVHSDSVYYKLSDAGFRPITDIAEVLFAIGPIVPTILGLLFGSGLLLIVNIVAKAVVRESRV